MAEWLKAHAWKVCLLERVTGVRIPLSPPKDPATAGFGVLGSVAIAIAEVDKDTGPTREASGPLAIPPLRDSRSDGDPSLSDDRKPPPKGGFFASAYSVRSASCPAFDYSTLEVGNQSNGIPQRAFQVSLLIKPS